MMTQSLAAKDTPKADVLRTGRDGAVAIFTLTDPDRRNALSEAMLRALLHAFHEVAHDSSVRAIIVAAEGSVFCAGHDLKELTAHRRESDEGRDNFVNTFALCSALMQTVVASHKPVIAAVEGMATAAGCQFVASCDLAVAGERAGFCTPGVNIGLFCATPMVALSRAVSRHHALEMLLLGETVPASEAFRIGLVNRVVPEGMALAEALTLARRIATKSPEAIAVGKAAFTRQADLPLAAAYEQMSRVMVDNLLGADAIEGIGAFLERRPARWPGS
jgi:enoyl-CoA hydratase/carnithine racemase